MRLSRAESPISDSGQAGIAYEAVTVILTYQDDAMKIRSIEWGRP